MSSLQSDIDYMKSLAEDGARGPMKNGAILFWAGLLYAGASVAEYGVAINVLPQTTAVQMGIWFGASLLFAILATLSSRGRAKSCNASSRAYNSAWSAVGIGIGVLIVSLFLLARQVQDVQAVTYMIAPVILVLYGMGWWVSAMMSGQGWLKAVSIGCFIGAPVMALMAGRPEQLLAYAGALILFATVPGLIIMRAPKA
jgi:preprotein translocase subunit SecG